MSLKREQYTRIVEIARAIYKLDAGLTVDNMAQELFDMSECIIGQQSPPLMEQEDTTP